MIVILKLLSSERHQNMGTIFWQRLSKLLKHVSEPDKKLLCVECFKERESLSGHLWALEMQPGPPRAGWGWQELQPEGGSCPTGPDLV